jgi:hypothetical protein
VNRCTGRRAEQDPIRGGDVGVRERDPLERQPVRRTQGHRLEDAPIQRCGEWPAQTGLEDQTGFRAPQDDDCGEPHRRVERQRHGTDPPDVQQKPQALRVDDPGGRRPIGAAWPDTEVWMHRDVTGVRCEHATRECSAPPPSFLFAIVSAA